MTEPTIYEAPKYPNKLNFNEKPPGDCAYFEHNFGDYALEARILYNEQHEKPHVLSVHGARADYTKANAVSFGLQERGISTLSINLSGHNDASPIPLETTSLAQNIEEAEAFYDYLDKSHPITLIGYSLGGAVVLELLKYHKSEIDRIILFYPAVYAREAYDKKFGEPFRSVIQVPFSFQQNDILSKLDDFPGKMMILKGQYDGLASDVPGTSAGNVTIDGKEYYSPIPKEVFDSLEQVKIPADRKDFIEVPGCGHSIILWMRDHKPEADKILDKLARFINE